MTLLAELRCFWSWPFGHDWEDVRKPFEYVGPLRRCRNCPALDYGNGEQSIGG